MITQQQIQSKLTPTGLALCWADTSLRLKGCSQFCGSTADGLSAHHCLSLAFQPSPSTLLNATIKLLSLEPAPYFPVSISPQHFASSDSQILPYPTFCTLIYTFCQLRFISRATTLQNLVWGSQPAWPLGVLQDPPILNSLKEQSQFQESPLDLATRGLSFPRFPISSFLQLLIWDGVSLWGKPHVNQRRALAGLVLLF